MIKCNKLSMYMHHPQMTISILYPKTSLQVLPNALIQELMRHMVHIVFVSSKILFSNDFLERFCPEPAVVLKVYPVFGCRKQMSICVLCAIMHLQASLWFYIQFRYRKDKIHCKATGTVWLISTEMSRFHAINTTKCINGQKLIRKYINSYDHFMNI